uniref:UDP-glucuronosyltransferase n=1 Tax=Trialeurodes vaporariorum TaxID=88556 RepID=A0A873P538_TRIVP|nr:UDP-gluconosyltransferase [Trialeurodes vaporariorum]
MHYKLIVEEPELAADPYLFRYASAFDLALFHWKFGTDMQKMILAQPLIQQFIQQKNQKFDVIIAEILFSQEPFVALGDLFQAPIIDFSSQCGTHYVYDILFNPGIYSYVSDYRTYYSDRMTLYQRLINTLIGLFQVYGSYWYYFQEQEQIMYANFNLTYGAQNKPSLKHLLRNNIVGSIFNSDPLVGYPKPLLPSSIEVGGISLQPRKPLPKDLQKFMDEAEHGVVYFSFGSILSSEKMPPVQKQYFIEAFKRLKQRVLWKIENSSDIELPSNVLTSKWFPQGDVLAHPKCRLFITHGGYLSLIDTVDAGVPVIVIPFFADQPKNAHIAETKGFGIHLHFDDLTADLIVETIDKVVTNKSYSVQAKKMSSLFRDRIVSPVEKAVHLVEYTIRHKGNPLSQTGAKDLWWYQYFLLDVAAIIIAVILFVFIFLYKVLGFFVRFVIGSSRNSQPRISKQVKNGKKTN